MQKYEIGVCFSLLIYLKLLKRHFISFSVISKRLYWFLIYISLSRSVRKQKTIFSTIDWVLVLCIHRFLTWTIPVFTYAIWPLSSITFISTRIVFISLFGVKNQIVKALKRAETIHGSARAPGTWLNFGTFSIQKAVVFQDCSCIPPCVSHTTSSSYTSLVAIFSRRG